MGKEIERKFLVNDDTWRKGQGERYRQGWLSLAEERSVRVRATPRNAYLTIKGAGAGATRTEFEYEIPLDEANELLDTLCHRPLIEKTRYNVEHGGFVWEIDEFHGENQGLIVAEVELESEDQEFEKPNWVGAEVTGDPRYLNVNLSVRPYARW